MNLSQSSRAWLFALACVVVAGGAYASSRLHYFGVPALVASANGAQAAATSTDPYTKFDMEAYASIKDNYWQAAGDKDLALLFQQSLQKAELLGGMTMSSTTLPSEDATGTREMLASAFLEATSSSAKENLATAVLQVALYNIAPAGRDQLLSQQAEVALRQEVQNVNPQKDLYGDLGLAASVSIPEIVDAYRKKRAELAVSTSSDAQAQLQAAKYAADVLSSTSSKERYDATKVEPTIFTHAIGRTLYMDVSRMSPTTLQEFSDALDAASTTPGLDSMILDLRGNIGGDLDDGAGFLGLWIGQNQYAYDLFHQGTYDPVRTQTGNDSALARYSDLAVLTDGQTQSTAEVLTAALKRFHLAHVVGTTTRGWGTVENTFPLATSIDASTTYALLLVHSITLREDNQPVEGRGVDPDVSIQNPNWQSQLQIVFRSQSLIAVLKKVATQPPIQ